MLDSKRTLRRTAQAIAATAATLALAAPTALAATSGSQHNDPWYRYAVSHTQQNTPDPWYGYALSLTARTLAGTNSKQSDPWYRYAISYSTPSHASNQNGSPFITDTLGGNGGAAQPLGYRFISDTLGGSGGTPLATLASSGNGFNWGDAAIGAAGATGAALLLIGGSLLVLRKRSRLAI